MEILMRPFWAAINVLNHDPQKLSVRRAKFRDVFHIDAEIFIYFPNRLQSEWALFPTISGNHASGCPLSPDLFRQGQQRGHLAGEAPTEAALLAILPQHLAGLAIE
jgi:hypothetical protein